jgi:hypothetical protein
LGVTLLGVDEFGEPAHLALGALLGVLRQGGAPRVGLFAAAVAVGATGVQSFLQAVAPSFEDEPADVGLGPREEGEAHLEGVVLGGVGPGAAGEGFEVLLALGCELVGDPRAGAGGGARTGAERVIPGSSTWAIRPRSVRARSAG